MILQCTNSNCRARKELDRIKFILDGNGNTKRDDSKCDECGSKMINPESINKDFSNIKMKKPLSDRSRQYYTRGKKRK